MSERFRESICSEERAVAPSGSPGRPTTVLLIDDDLAMRDRLAAALRADGWPVVVADDGDSGARLLETVREPFAIVLEPNLVGSSWYHLLSLAARSVASTRLIVLTAFWSSAMDEESRRAGAAACLRKPVGVDQLRALVRGEAGRGPALAPTSSARAASLAAVEWEYVNKVIRDCGGNMSRAARLLGIHRPSLYKKLRKHPPPR
jgi:two-component system, response regulator RegA